MAERTMTFDYPTPLFARSIASREREGEVMTPVDTVDLQIGPEAQPAEMQIRSQGAYITRLALLDGQRQRADLLYTPPSLTPAKLTASHAMLPVGPSTEVGGQHGFPRWASYRTALVDKASNKFRAARLEAYTDDAPVAYARSFTLTTTQMTAVSRLYNQGTQPIQTSMGEHLYFNMPRGASVHDVRINDRSINALLGRGVAEQIESGQAYFWPGYEGEATVQLPHTATFHLDAHLKGSAYEQRTPAAGALLWQRATPEGQQSQPYLCIEPVFGYTDPAKVSKNRELVVPRRGHVAMVTTISM